MTTPYSSKIMWAGSLKATIELILIGNNLVEMWVNVGNGVPSRYRGTVSEMENRADLWFANRRAEGFEEQSPSHNLHAWIS